MAFNRPASNKQLTFGEISLKTKLPENEVYNLYFHITCKVIIFSIKNRLNCLL